VVACKAIYSGLMPPSHLHSIMTIQEYLKSELNTCSRYALSDQDKVSLDKVGLEEFIDSKLTFKKFRKWKIDDLSERQVKQALSLSVARNKPL
jgi:hypothetical protein